MTFVYAYPPAIYICIYSPLHFFLCTPGLHCCLNSKMQTNDEYLVSVNDAIPVYPVLSEGFRQQPWLLMCYRFNAVLQTCLSAAFLSPIIPLLVYARHCCIVINTRW